MSKLRLGLIGRPETHRGLGIQTQEFSRHMDVAKTLMVIMPTNTGPRNYSAFSAPMGIDYDPIYHRLPEHIMREFLQDLDVVFTAETPYDWSLLPMAKKMGVKTVIQGNPEFVRHGRKGYEHMPHPDEWWWPSTWRLDRLPPGRFMPVPMSRVDHLASTSTDRLRVLHVAGKRAWQDRNGTEMFFQAVSMSRRPMDVTVIGVDGELPSMTIPRVNLNVHLMPDGVEDRWEMYKGHHALVLPRRYGGLCLPALEAAAAGLAVLMPDCPPNELFTERRTPILNYQPLDMACGVIDASRIDPMFLAYQLDELADNLDVVMAEGRANRESTLWWTPEGTTMYEEGLGALL